MIRIHKRFKGHAANQLRVLLQKYKPPSKTDVMKHVYDPTEDGPEVEIIKFFQMHPRGYKFGIAECLHVKGL